VAVDFDFYMRNTFFSISVILFRNTTLNTTYYPIDVDDASTTDDRQFVDGYYFVVSFFRISPTPKNVSVISDHRFVMAYVSGFPFVFH
jgi:hypothetical protein